MGKVKSNPDTRRPTFIRDWRNFRDLTLEQVAERIDVTAGALSQLERGEVQYTQPMLEALARELQCEPADLIARPPGSMKGIEGVWDQIPVQDRPRAIQILMALAGPRADD